MMKDVQQTSTEHFKGLFFIVIFQSFCEKKHTSAFAQDKNSSSSGLTFIENHLEVGQIQLLVLCCAVALESWEKRGKLMNHVGTFHLNDLDRFCPPASAVWRAARMSERHLWKFPWKNPWANVMGYLGLCSVHWWAKFQLITASTDLWMVVGNRDYAYWYNDVYLPTAMDLRVLVKSYDWHDSSYHVSMPHESFFLQFLHVFFFIPLSRKVFANLRHHQV